MHIAVVDDEKVQATRYQTRLVSLRRIRAKARRHSETRISFGEGGILCNYMSCRSPLSLSKLSMGDMLRARCFSLLFVWTAE